MAVVGLTFYNTILQLRGIDTYREFMDRHQKAMARPEFD